MLNKIINIIKGGFSRARKALARWAEKEHFKRLAKGCEYCGGIVACDTCYRCADRNCNAGCIFCRRF